MAATSSDVIRAVNESVRAFAKRLESESIEWDFICECDDPDCHALVSLTLEQYDELRDAAPPEPVLADHNALFDS